MTSRVSAIIKDYGQWIYEEDILDIYNDMVANGLDPDNVCDETLKRVVKSYTEERERLDNERL